MADYQWIREDPTEFFTGSYDTQGNPIYDIPEDVKVYSFVDIGETEEVINPIKAQSLYPYLHSLLRNSFYKSLTDAQESELQNLLNEAMKLANIYNTDLFLGSEVEYKSRVTNVTTLLGFNLPLFFADRIGAQTGEQILGERIKWYRELLQSTYLLRRWAGSTLGYRVLFKLIKKRGTLFLRAQYKTDNFTSQTDRFFRILSAENFSGNLIESPTYPTSFGISGEEDYANAKLRLIQFDTRLSFDKTGESDPPSRFDSTVQFAGATTKGLSFEISLDEILRHYNSIKTNKCLIDNDWLKALSTFMPTVKKGSDKVSIGTQLSLTALSNGRYTKYPEGITEEDQKKFLYTHPNIEARFQMFPSLFGIATNVSYIKLGSGTLQNVFNDSTTENFAILMKDYPTEIAKPLFQSFIGYNEQFLLGKYKTVSVMVHTQKFTEQKIQFENVLINKELTPVTQVTTIKFPHSSISPGSFSFTLHVPSPNDDPYKDRFIYITQTYNDILNLYDPLIVVKKPTAIISGNDVAAEASRLLEMGFAWESVTEKCQSKFGLDYNQVSKLTQTGENTVVYGEDDEGLEVIKRVLKEISVRSYSMFVNNTEFFSFDDPIEASFMKGDSDSFLTFKAFDDVKDSNGDPVFANIDLLAGTLKLKLVYNIENEIGRVAGEGFSDYDSLACGGVVSYEINSLKSGSVDQLDLEAASRVAITELGVFDDRDRLIGYATFPPIIYDSSKFHSSYNLAMDTTPMIDTPLRLDNLVRYYSFDDVPEIPSAPATYLQDTWATTDGWSAGLGVNALDISYETTALEVEGTGSYSFHQIYKSGLAVTGQIVRLKIKYNSNIESITVIDGSTEQPMYLYKQDGYYIGTYTVTETTSQLTIYVHYKGSLEAKTNVSQIDWIYVGDGSYTSLVEDESLNNNGALITRAFPVTGIQNKGMAFLDPTCYLTI